MATSELTAFRLRDATPADADSINRLCIAAYEEFRDEIGAIKWPLLRETLSRTSELSSEGELIVAEDSSGLLGVVLYVPPRQTKEALIRTLAVAPKHRRRGVGRRLTQECIDRARQAGAQTIALTTGQMMIVALLMYERMGFIKQSELGKRFGVQHASYVLKLK
jgi:ribosomal protein S18 acetylase RimI-like enzyme